MTIQEVANHFYRLSQENKFGQIQDELYADDAVSIEPPHAASQGLTNASGLKAIRQKGEAFTNMMQEMHSAYSGEPIVAGNFFAVAMGMDVTMKSAVRIKFDEIAVYEVRDGRIVKEQFFF